MQWYSIKKNFPLFFEEFSKSVNGFITEDGDYEIGMWYPNGKDYGIPRVITAGILSEWMVMRGVKETPLHFIQPITVTFVKEYQKYKVGEEVFASYSNAVHAAVNISLSKLEEKYKAMMVEQYGE